MAPQEFSVNLWGSDPHTNDDCWTGEVYSSIEEAREVFDSPWDHFNKSYHNTSTAFIVLNGPGVYEEKKNPDFVPSVEDDSDWKHEIAMEAGMLHGCEGYNEVMGY